jgi:hypothetical protein
MSSKLDSRIQTAEQEWLNLWERRPSRLRWNKIPLQERSNLGTTIKVLQISCVPKHCAMIFQLEGIAQFGPRKTD